MQKRPMVCGLSLKLACPEAFTGLKGLSLVISQGSVPHALCGVLAAGKDSNRDQDSIEAGKMPENAADFQPPALGDFPRVQQFAQHTKCDGVQSAGDIPARFVGRFKYTFLPSFYSRNIHLQIALLKTSLLRELLNDT